MEDLGEDALEALIGDLSLPSLRGCNEGAWDSGDRSVYKQAPEHCGAVHIHLPHYGPFLGYGEEDEILDTDNMVVTGGPGIYWD